MIETLRKWFAQANVFLSRQIWEQELTGRPWIEAFALRQLRVGIIVVKGVLRGGLSWRASAMTLTTLLAVGPALILAFAVFRTIGGLPDLEAQLERLIYENIMPAQQASLRAWLESFLGDVRNGAYGGITVVFLGGGVLGLLSAIESAFNDIWGVRSGRPLWKRFNTYTTIIVVTPILVALSVSLTATLQSSNVLYQWLDWLPQSDILIRFGFRLLPIVFAGLALTVLYMVMPNASVRLRAALPAGFAAAVIWEFSKIGYTIYLQTSTIYENLYGSLAALPLFLVWVHVTWIVVLFGAQLTFAQTAADDIREEEMSSLVSQSERIRAAVHLSVEAARSYLAEESAPNLPDLAHRMVLPLRLVREVAEMLTDSGILHQVRNGRDGGIAPARSPERVTVYQVVASIVNHGHVPSRKGAEVDRVTRATNQILDELDAALREEWSQVSLVQCLDRGVRPDDILPFPVKE